jgi:hypothetical protein
MAAETHDVYLGHAGRKIARKLGKSKRGAGSRSALIFISKCRVYDSKPLTAVIEMKSKFS